MKVLAFALILCTISSSAIAVTVNIDFNGAFFGAPSSDYVSPAGERTSGYWNRASAFQNLRTSGLARPGIIGRWNSLVSGGSQFSAGDFTNLNVALSDAAPQTPNNPTGGFSYTLTGLENGHYDVFLYARSASIEFLNSGSSIVYDNVSQLVGEIYTYAFSAHVSNGTLSLGQVPNRNSWIAGMQITNDPVAVSVVPLPASSLFLLSGVLGLLQMRRFR